MKGFALYFLLLVPVFCYAQNPKMDKLKWDAQQFKDAGNATINHPVSIITNPGVNELQWIQKNGAKVYRFEITETSGNWNDVTVDGILTFVITSGNQSGQAKVQRQSGTTTIELEILIASEVKRFTFLINQVNISE